MNKVLLTVFRGKNLFPASLFNLCCRQIYQVETCPFSLVHNTDIQRQKYQILSPFHSLTSLRYMGFVSRLKNKLTGFISVTTKVQRGGILTYEKIVDDINYVEFFQYFGLPDTFQSWFSCMQLHVYITVLVMMPQKHGRVFRNSVIDTMWNDVEIRLGHLTEMTGSQKKKYLKELVEQFNATFIAYDEGILSDDKTLAGSCWRMLFACRNIDPEILENCVLYIRRQIAHLDSQNLEQITMKGSISFLPLNDVIVEEKRGILV